MNVSTQIKKIRGFTLIEVLTVAAVISILAAIILVSIDAARDTGDDARRKADMEQLQLALKIYASTHNEYPETKDGSLSALDVLVEDGYIKTLPSDPTGDGLYPDWSGSGSDENTYYYWRADDMPSGCSASGYILWYHLEGSTDGNAGCVRINDHSYTVIK